MSSNRRSVRIHNHNDDALGTKLHERRDRCIKQLKDAIVQQIPPQTSFDIVDLQNFYYKENYAVILGLAYVVVYVVILLYLSVTASQTEYNKKFLAIDALTIGQSVCQDIPVSVTGTYSGDSNGKWSTNPSFLQNSSIYEIQFTGSLITLEQYKTSFATFHNRLKSLGAISAKRELAWNLVAWSSFHVYDQASKLAFYSTASIATIMKHVTVDAVAIASRDGVCTKSGVTGSYDPLTSSFVLTIPRAVTPASVPTKAPTTPYPTPASPQSYLQTSRYLTQDCSGPIEYVWAYVPDVCIQAGTSWKSLSLSPFPVIRYYISSSCSGNSFYQAYPLSGVVTATGTASIGSTSVTIVADVGTLSPSTTYSVSGDGIAESTTTTTSNPLSGNTLTLSKATTAGISSGSLYFSILGLCSESSITSVVTLSGLRAIIGKNETITAEADSMDNCRSRTVHTLSSYSSTLCRNVSVVSDDDAALPSSKYISWNCFNDHTRGAIYSDNKCSIRSGKAISQPLSSYNCTHGYSAGTYRYNYCSSQDMQIGGGPPTAAPSTVNDYTKIEPCPSQFSLFAGDFLPTYPGSNSISLPFDIRSISTCIAVNLGIITTKDLLRTRTSISQGAFLGSFFIDPFYQGMAEIFCLDGFESPGICFVMYNVEPFYPVLASFYQGQFLGQRRPCTCPTASKRSDCNMLRSMSLSLLFSRSLTRDGRVSDLYSLAQSFRSKILAALGDPTATIGKVSQPMITAATIMGSGVSPSDILSWMQGITSWGSKALDFFEYQRQFDDIGKGFSAVSFIFSSPRLFNEINDNKVDLVQFSSEGYNAVINGGFSVISCVNTIFQEKTMALLATVPPVELVQPFKQCHTTLFSAATAAVGSSNGIAQIACGLVLSALSMLLVYWVNRRASDDKMLVPPATKSRDLQDQLDLEKEELINMVETMKVSIDALLAASSVRAEEKEMLIQQLASASIIHHVQRNVKLATLASHAPPLDAKDSLARPSEPMVVGRWALL